MWSYEAPLRDMEFVLEHWLQAPSAWQALDLSLAMQVLEEAARFSQGVLAPLNSQGDRQGCRWQAGQVSTPDGFVEAYQAYVDGGWPGLACAEAVGGQGLPQLLDAALQEMLYASNHAWAMYTGIAHGAYLCLKTHAEQWLQARYLPEIVSGQALPTMCLTEPQAGSDVGLLRCRAEPQADGSYRLSGSKLFISGGEHDLTANILHLVLARLPDAPPGSRGISLFLVPKRLDDGHVNGVRCDGLEHKMGIKGSATAQIVLDGAVGTMVGQANKGMNGMFVMMNAARLGVGNQSLGLTEVAYQNALAYAKDRIQMRSLSGAKRPDLAADPIIVHPDVRKMLLTARAYAEGARALVYFVAVELDKEHNHPDEAVRKESSDIVALLTPIVKAFITDNAWISTVHCQQVYGGHGFIHEWGMEQFVRDARINMIYEGTNTVQSLDLLGRKVLGDGGAKLTAFGKKIGRFVKENADNEAMQEFTKPLGELGQKVQAFTMEIGMKGMQNPDEVGAAAVDYLRVVGHLVYSYFFAMSAKIALEKQASDDTFYKAKLATARFYFTKLAPEVETLMITAKAGLKPLTEMDEALF